MGIIQNHIECNIQNYSKCAYNFYSKLKKISKSIE